MLNVELSGQREKTVSATVLRFKHGGGEKRGHSAFSSVPENRDWHHRDLKTGTGTAFGGASPCSAAILVEVEDFGEGFVNPSHECR